MTDNEAPLSESRATDEDPKDLPSEDVGDDDEVTPEFWIVQLERARAAAAPHLKASDEAVREYMGSFTEEPVLKSPIKVPETRFPLFWSSVRTIQPALYSRSPIPQSSRLFDEQNDELSRLGSVCIERLAKYLIKSCPFDRTQHLTRDDYILTGKTINRVCYYAELADDGESEGSDEYGEAGNDTEAPGEDRGSPSEEPYEEGRTYYVQEPQPDGSMVFINDAGDVLPDGVDLQQDDSGQFYTEDPKATLEREYITLEPVSYRDVLHSPNARHWDEVDWIAFKSLLNKSDIRKRFGNDMAERIQYSATIASVKDKDKKEELDNPFAAVWEIWDREKHKVYFLAEDFEDDFLEPPKDDPYGLPGFFPCPPFMLGTVGPEDMYPVPDFVQLRPMILQLHALSKRLKTLVRATRRRGIFDNSIEELKNLATDTDEAEFLGVSNWQTIMSKGGLQNLVQYFPNEEIANTMQLIFQVFQQYQTMFQQIWGIPDILTGSSDPSETAAAQQLKQKNAGLRFSATQKEFQRLVRDDIEIMCDIALSQFEQSTLMQIMGFKFMSPPEQQMFPLMLDLLKDKVERPIRIDIQTDSTIQMNQDEDLQQAQQVASEILSSFAQIVQVSNGHPPILELGLKVLMMVIRKMPDGKLIENDLEQAMQALINPPPPQGPPPPDPAMVKAQAAAQAVQTKAQADIQVSQQKAQADMAVSQQKAQQTMQIEQAQLQHDSANRQLDAQLAQMEAQLKAQLAKEKAQFDMQIKQMEAKFQMLLEAMRVKGEVEAAKIEASKPETQINPQTRIISGPL